MSLKLQVRVVQRRKSSFDAIAVKRATAKALADILKQDD